LPVEGLGEFTVSIVDAANPCVFVKASDVGLTGTEKFEDVLANDALWAKADKIRGTVAVKLGMFKDLASYLAINPTMPFCVFVQSPVDYIDYDTGKVVPASSYDLKGTIRFAGAVHRAYSGTGSVCTSVAAMLDGTVANDVISDAAKKTNVFRIGHPSGVMEDEIQVVRDGADYKILRAAYGRTARRIMEGYIHLKPWADEITVL